MKKINYTYKYRLKPNESQKQMFEQYFGSVRFVYNYFLNLRQTQYKATGKSDSYYQQQKQLTELKQEAKYSWLKLINSQTLQVALQNLESAYTGFFRRKSKYPVFKKKRYNNSFCVPQNIKVDNQRIYIPKFKEGIKLKEHRKLEGKICFATISKTCTNKYFVSITVEKEIEPQKSTGKEVGIDLGIKELVICSNGSRFANNKYISKYSKKLKKAQQHLSRKVKGSHQYEKQRLKVALIQEKISNCRIDNLHKISSKLIKENDLICLEDLNVKGMMANHKLSKSISDVSWSELTRMLDYKGNWNDVVIHKINRWYPSSKTCNHCGYIKSDLTLDDRYWTCPKCHSNIDRDLNAAINILEEGKRELSAGTVDYTNGETVRHNNISNNVITHDSMKLEAPCFS